MPQTPLEVLAQWEDSGARWRLDGFEGPTAVVQLLSCLGEPVDRLRSSDPALVALVRARPSSED